jgi:phosphoglucosamine mutase
VKKTVKNLFGTDGIRGVANRYPMDCETALKTGRAVASFYKNEVKNDACRFVVGQDTRISGDMIVSAITAGICSMGISVDVAGVVPTPGIAYLTAAGSYTAGIMISASHNPFYDNGIKLFNADGYKLSDDQEEKIETFVHNDESVYKQCENIDRVGTVRFLGHAGEQYRAHLKEVFEPCGKLSGIKIVLDCSNGAASYIAPDLFTELGATVHGIFCAPNGTNINDHCGSQHTETLSKAVAEKAADAGLAFDGDADRLIAVDEKGLPLTGDQVLAICAKHMKDTGQLENPVVVTTVMSNLGLGAALEKMGIRHITANVGDRYVMQEMVKSQAILGGEDSGHMIFLNDHTTGDGMLAGLKLLDAIKASGKALSKLSQVMTVYPQCLINVEVQSKPDLETVDGIVRTIAYVEERLGKNGRVLVRYSGTQPQCRVMVEGPTKKETQAYCGQIAIAVKEALGK